MAVQYILDTHMRDLGDLDYSVTEPWETEPGHVRMIVGEGPPSATYSVTQFTDPTTGIITSVDEGAFLPYENFFYYKDRITGKVYANIEGVWRSTVGGGDIRGVSIDEPPFFFYIQPSAFKTVGGTDDVTFQIKMDADFYWFRGDIPVFNQSASLSGIVLDALGDTWDTTTGRDYRFISSTGSDITGQWPATGWTRNSKFQLEFSTGNFTNARIMNGGQWYTFTIRRVSNTNSYQLPLFNQSLIAPSTEIRWPVGSADEATYGNLVPMITISSGALYPFDGSVGFANWPNPRGSGIAKWWEVASTNGYRTV